MKTRVQPPSASLHMQRLLSTAEGPMKSEMLYFRCFLACRCRADACG